MIARKPFFVLLAVVAALMSTSACSLVEDLGPAENPPNTYGLTAPTSFPTDLPRASWSLLIVRPSAGAGLDTDKVAVRPQPLRLQYYAGATWAENAPDMLQALIITSFQNADAVKAVGSSNVELDAQYRLVADLVTFEAAYGQGSDVPEVRVRLNATLVAQPDESVVASRDFTATVTPGSAQVPDVMKAFDDATSEVLRDLVQWTVTAPGPGV